MEEIVSKVAEVWSETDIDKRDQVLRRAIEMHGIPHIDYRRGPHTPFSRFRITTQKVIAGIFEKEGWM